MHPRTALVIQHLQTAMRQRSTLEQLIENPAIRSLASTDELSRPQLGLIAATVSVMQDKLIEELSSHGDELRKTLEAERFMFASIVRNIADGIKSLYSLPIIKPLKTQPSSNMAKTWRYADWLTWGNFSAAAAVVLLAVSVFYTKAYSSYKDRAQNQAEIITGRNNELASLRTQRDVLVNDANKLRSEKQEAEKTGDYNRALAEERERQIATLTTQSADAQAIQSTLGNLQGELATVKAENESLKAQTRGGYESSVTYQNLFESERDRYEKLNQRFIKLNDENRSLKNKLEETGGLVNGRPDFV